jgi:hypothetical protein
MLITIPLLSLSIQAHALVEAKALGAVDTVFEMTKESFKQHIEELPEARSYLEGKLQAAYIDMIDNDLRTIEKELASINSLEDIDQSDLERIQNDIQEVQSLINEMQ